MKNTLFKNRINWIQSIFSLVIIGACSSAYAIQDPWYDMPWKNSTISNIPVKEMANNRSYRGTRRVCGNDDHEYGVIMLHGTAGSPSQGIRSITHASGNYGNMNVMMEKFADDCALVYVPGAQLGRWDWRSTSEDSDEAQIATLINHMHNTYSYNGEKIKIFLIGGSSGAVMAHHVAKYHINNPDKIKLAGLAGVVIADGVSSTLLCPQDCDNPSNKPANSGQIVYQHPNGVSLFEVHPNPYFWAFENAIISGVFFWDLPTLLIQSEEPLLDEAGNPLHPLTPSLYKNELSNALFEVSGSGSLVQIERESNGAHDPWTDNANNLIHQFIQDTLN